MTLLGLILSLLFVPNIQNKTERQQRPDISTILRMFNPLRIFRPYIYPNVFLSVSLIQPSPASLLKLTQASPAPHLRLPRHLPIRHPHIRPLNLQPTLPPNHPPRQRTLLPLPRNRLPNRQRPGRATLRPRSQEMDRQAQRRTSPPRPTEQRSRNPLRRPPRFHPDLRLDVAGGSGRHAGPDYQRVLRGYWVAGLV